MKRICLFIACLAMILSLSAAKKVTWVIDAGHGGRDTGCEGILTKEKNITLAVAKEVGRLVKKNIDGVRVVYTREKDKYLTLQERCDVANNCGAALFISIHVNSAANQFARGTESFFATNVPMKGTQAGKSELLALLLQRQYLSHGREISRGVKQRELYVCEHTNMPSVLTEIGFISNFNEEAYLNSKDGQRELAEAIYQSLAEWQDMTKNGTVSQRDLRRLRITHYAPISMATVTTQPAPTPQAEPQEEEVQPESPEQAPIAQEQALVAQEQAVTNPGQAPTGPETSEKTIASTETSEKTAAVQKQAPTGSGTPEKAAASPENPDKPGTPFFAIQLMNTATKLEEGDYRLKGYKGVQQIPANGRFKIIYGHSESYKDIKNELALVRETFPEAFIVAFVGEKQITTAEAIQLLK